MKLAVDEKALWPAEMATGSTADTEMVSTVAVTTTWRLERGRLVPAPAAERWPVLVAPGAIQDLPLQPDTDWRRTRAEVLVLGQAVAPRPVAELRIAIACGAIRHESALLGVRTWRKRLFGWAMTEPAPFTIAAIGNEMAYGGVSAVDGEPSPHPLNPVGRGYHLSTAALDGSPLPTLEHPQQRIRAWSDRPAPSLWYKPAGAALPDPLPADPVATAVAMQAQAFAEAPAHLGCEAPELGRELALDGFAASGILRFPMPERAPARLRVDCGAARGAFDLAPRRVVALPQCPALIVTYAATCRWRFRPREERRAWLEWHAHA